MLVIENSLPFDCADADHAILIDPLERHFLDGDDVGPLADLARGIHHLRQTAALMLNQHVRQQQRERFVADQFARAPHRVAETERLLLAGEAGCARRRQIMPQQVERLLLLPLKQRHFQLDLAVEMILDDALVAPGDEDEMFDAGLAGFIDNVLDQRPVDHRQHFLRHGLGRRQEAGAEPGDGENGFADRFHVFAFWDQRAGWWETLSCLNRHASKKDASKKAALDRCRLRLLQCIIPRTLPVGERSHLQAGCEKPRH